MTGIQLNIIEKFTNQFALFPGTKYMGSKRKIILDLWDIFSKYEFDSFLDAFGGSNVIGYFMKCKGKKVISNDFLAISYHKAKAIIENNNTYLTKSDVDFLLHNENTQIYIRNTFKNLYFSDADNSFLDKIRCNIDLLKEEYKKSLALAALTRACMKKRARGIFTFVGQRYDDGRKDLKKSLQEHFIENVDIFNNSVFDNEQECIAHNEMVDSLSVKTDMVYLDPPYFSPKSDNDYVRRYHFVEGLVKNWKGLEIQEHTKTKKFKSYYSPFSKKGSAYEAFENLIKNYKNSTIAISYSSNSLPTKEEMIQILRKHKENVDLYEIDHLYSFGNQNHKIGNKSNRVKEYLFIAE